MAKRAAGVVVVALGVAGLLGAISAAADEGMEGPVYEGVEVPAYVESAPIWARGLRGGHPAEGHGFTFAVDVSPCKGPNLSLDHVRLIERPENANHVKAAIVTAYLLHPAHIEHRACHKVRRIHVARIRTKRPAAELVFFDGSSSPPRRIFPLRPAPSH